MIAKAPKSKVKPANGHHVNRIKPLVRQVVHRANGNGSPHPFGTGRLKPGVLAAKALGAAARATAAPAASPAATRAAADGVELEIHPLAELLPPHKPEDYEALKEDILRTNRIRDEIVLLDGKIFDGRHRYRIGTTYGVPFKTRDFDPAIDGDPLDCIYSNALGRNMDKSQKAAAAVKLELQYEAQAKERMTRRNKLKAELSALSLKQLETQHPDCYGLLLSREDVVKNVLDKTLGKEPTGTSRDRAGRNFGVSGKLVQNCKYVHANAPELFEKVFNGEMPANQAISEYRNKQKEDALNNKAAAARVELKLDAKHPYELVCGDAMKILPTLDVRPRLIFTDPRYNLGLDYGLGKRFDSTPESVYLNWCKEWIVQDAGLLAEDGSIYVLIDSRHQDKIKTFMEQAGLFWRNTIIMGEAFANHTEDNYQPCARFIHYFCKHRERRVWNRGDILVPSARMTEYKDKRNAGPKVPGNMWRVAEEGAAGKKPADNVWVEFPRLVGTAAARLPGFPTQLDVRMVERIVKASSDPGDLVLDHFNGTGTTGEAAILNGRRYLGIDIVPRNVEWSEKRLLAVAAEMRGKK